jgi:hypothetical protein
MPYMNDRQCLLSVINFINDPVIADANTPPLSATQLDTARRPRFFSKCPDSITNPDEDLGRKFSQFLLGTPAK